MEARWAELIEGKSDGERMSSVISLRLRHLEPFVGSWASAMALGATPTNAPTTARNLALLADEMCHVAGLEATDARWYTNRAVVGGVYAAAEVFMLRDASPGFRDTHSFVARRVAEAQALVSPGSASQVDAALERCLPPGAAAALGTVASAGAQAVLGALTSLIPAGAAPHTRASARRSAGGSSGGSGGGDGGDGDGDGWGATFPPPPEDRPATAAEMAEFDRQAPLAK